MKAEGEGEGRLCRRRRREEESNVWASEEYQRRISVSVTWHEWKVSHAETEIFSSKLEACYYLLRLICHGWAGYSISFKQKQRMKSKLRWQSACRAATARVAAQARAAKRRAGRLQRAFCYLPTLPAPSPAGESGSGVKATAVR